MQGSISMYETEHRPSAIQPCGIHHYFWILAGPFGPPLMPGPCLSHRIVQWSQDGAKPPPTGSGEKRERPKPTMALCGERQEFLESAGPIQTSQRTAGDLQKDVERLGYTWQPIEKGRRLRTVEVPLSAACTIEVVIGDRQRERSAFISHTDSRTCFLSSHMACSVATGPIHDAHRQCHFYKSAKD